MTSSLRIGILPGSSRANSNNTGVAEWVQARLETLFTPSSGSTGTTQLFSLTSDPLPLGPMTDDIVPAAMQGTPLASNPRITDYPYPNQRAREWSHLVQALDALVIVTPQYNWGYPGELKNTLDHIFPEWVGLPIAVFTYGGRGGGRCAEAMKLVLGGLKCEAVSCGEVQIILPGHDYISGGKRVEKVDEWLKQYEAVVDAELGKVVEAAERRNKSKEQTSETLGGK